MNDVAPGSDLPGHGPAPVPRIHQPGLFEALWRFKWQIVVVTLLATIAGYGLSLLQAEAFEAEAQLILTDPRSSGVFENDSVRVDASRYVRNQAQYAGSAEVAARALELLPDDYPLTLREVTSSVAVTPSMDVDLLTIRATQPTAEGSALLANAVAEAYQQLVREQVQANAASAITELTQSKEELTARLNALEQSLADNPENSALQAERNALVAQLVAIDTRIEQINVNMALYGSGVQHFEAAEVPTSRAAPQPRRFAAAAGLLGLLAAAAYAWWRTESQPLAMSRHDPAPILGAPLLAEIPDFATTGVDSPAPTIFEPNSAATEAYQFLVSSLDFAMEKNGGSTVMITSPRKGDGKTATALNMSVASVISGTATLLVDADERARGLSLTGDRDHALGLTDFAQGDDLDIADCLQRWKVSDEHELSVLPAGSRVTSAAGFFRSPEFRKAMTTLRGVAPIVVVDSPPVLAASEASDIASQVDGIILVVSRGTPLPTLEETRQRLDMTGKPLLGYVFNRAVLGSERYGYYGYGYGYGYGNDHPQTGGIDRSEGSK